VCAYIYIYIYIYIYTHTHICVCVCVCVCVYIYIYIYIYTHTHTHIRLRRDCIRITLANKQYCPWNIFTQIGSSAKYWLDIYHCGAGLALTGRIRDIGKYVLQSYFQTGSRSSPKLLPTFPPYCILWGGLY